MCAIETAASSQERRNMLMIVALMLAAPQNCTVVKQQCRACTSSNGKQLCSNIGIACQPSIRICRPKDTKTPSNGPKLAKPNDS